MTTQKDHERWIWDQPLAGTSLFPHHRRWHCRNALLDALRFRDVPSDFWRSIGRADAFNAIMYDVGDPLAYAYRRRIDRAKARHGCG